MPELPEVQTVLDGVVASIGKRKLKSMECFYPGTVIKSPNLKAKVFPAALLAHRRRGKYMILDLEGGHSLIVHLRMTGKLVWDKDSGPDHIHERACFRLEDKQRLRFIDPRTFGKIILCPSSEVESYLPNLGAEPLEDSFSASYLQARLAGRKLPVKNALLDQRIVAGLGNIYVCEILYRVGLHPDTPAGQIKLPMLRKIVSETRTVLKEALANNGTSISDFRRVDDKQGGFQEFLRVYQQDVCPLGHPIQKMKHSGRGTFFCPVCQQKRS